MDNRRKKEITLLSGIKCVIQELTGESEFLLTNAKSSAKKEGLDLLMLDCIVSIGGATPTKPIILQMLAADRRMVLVEIRQFSNEYDPSFNFSYEWPLDGGQKQKFKYEVEFTEANFKSKPYATQWKEIHEIKREVDFILPVSKKKVRWTILDGENEAKISAIPEDERSSHTMIELHKPVYMIPIADKDGEEREMKVDLKKMGWSDLNALRKNIIDTEGDMDTYLVIAHQENKAKTIRIDLIGVPAFFFPSLGH